MRTFQRSSLHLHIYYLVIFFKITVLVLDISLKVDIIPSLPIPEYFHPPNGCSKLLKKLAPFITAPPHSNLSAIFFLYFITSDFSTKSRK